MPELAQLGRLDDMDADGLHACLSISPRQYLAHLFLLVLCTLYIFTSPTLSVVLLMLTQISSFVFATCDFD